MSAAAVHVLPASSLLEVSQRPRYTSTCLLACDVVAVLSAALIWMQLLGGIAFTRRGTAAELAAVFSAVMLFAVLDLYAAGTLSPPEEFRKVFLGLSVSSLSAGGVAIWQNSRLVHVVFLILLNWLLAVAFTLLFRAVIRGCCGRCSWWGTPTIVLGAGEPARQIVETLDANPSFGLRVVAVLGEGCGGRSDHAPHQRLFSGFLNSAPVIAREHGINHAIVAFPDLAGSELAQLIRNHARDFRRVLVIPNLDGLSSLGVASRDMNGVLGLQITQGAASRSRLALKRAFDCASTSIAMFLLLPPLFALWLAVRISSPGPVFYGQRRIGKNGAEFTAWKFRSMHPRADELLAAHLAANPELKEEWERDHKLKNDPRVTGIGRLLRKTSMDELPQLWNVARGDMSLVGPRPIVRAETARYGEHLDAYLSVRPGITGLWQVSGRNNTTYEERVRYDEYYVRNWSVWLDLYILARTVRTVVLSEGAY